MFNHFRRAANVLGNDGKIAQLEGTIQYLKEDLKRSRKLIDELYTDLQNRRREDTLALLYKLIDKYGFANEPVVNEAILAVYEINRYAKDGRLNKTQEDIKNGS